MVKPENRTPLLHDPSGSGVIGRQGSESIDDREGRAEVSLNSVMFMKYRFLRSKVTKNFAGDLCAQRL